MALRSTFWAVLLLLAAGCGGDTDQTVEVQGRVFFRGKPVEGGTIVFAPDPARGGSGPLAQAEIQPDGRYRLMSGGKAGAVPGWHRVTVAPAGAAGSATRTLPARFSDPELSGQSHEVKPGKYNNIDLYLE
jgi:hypothetical protein